MESIYQEIESEDPSPPELIAEHTPPPFSNQLSPAQLAEWHWANVVNLDIFLQRVYEYYNYRGFYCIILARLLQMFTVAFVVWFSTFVIKCIDYNKLKEAATFSEARVPQCLAHTSWTHHLFLWLFSVGWLLKAFQYVSDIRCLWEMHEFYHHLLHISENEIQTISWLQVMERLVNLKSTNGSTRRKLDTHEIVNRIMRQENYMIGLYNKNILDLKIDLPFGFGTTEFFTKILEFSISMCLDDYVFNDKGHIRSIVLKESKRDLLAQGLRRRFKFAALMNILLAPLAAVYSIAYYFFRYFNEYYSTPKNLGSRQYTPLAEWRLREFNELYHLFRRRLSMSELPAQRYISQFPRYKTELVLKFVIFILSSFAAVLLVLSVYDSELLTLDMKLSLTTLGLAIVIARAMLSAPQEQAIYHPEASMRQIIEFTHYMPEHWEGKLHTEPIKAEFCTLYDLKPKIIAREIASLFLNPAILWYQLANRSERIIDFFREFSVNVDELGGQVCTLAVFNTDRAAKVKERSDALDKFYSTQDGKMLKSYLNFMEVYNGTGGFVHHSQFQASEPLPNPPPHHPHPSNSHPDYTQRQNGPQMNPKASVIGPQPGPSQAASPPSTHSDNMVKTKYKSSFKPSKTVSNSDKASEITPPEPPLMELTMESSVMQQYEQMKLKDLTPIQEDTSTPHSTLSSQVLTNDNEDSLDESIARDGVIGLLNNLYKK